MGITPLCSAYLFYSSIVEGRGQLNSLNNSIVNERLKYLELYKLGKYELSYVITNNYDPKLHLAETDLNNVHYKEVMFSRTSYDEDRAKRIFYTQIAEAILSKLLKLKLINCYYLTDGGQEEKYLFFLRCFSSKLVATETFAKLYMLAMHRLLDPISPYWPELLNNINNNEEIQCYTAKEQDDLFKQARKDIKFKPLFI